MSATGTLSDTTGLHVKLYTSKLHGKKLITEIDTSITAYQHTLARLGGFVAAQIDFNADEPKLYDFLERALGMHVEVFDRIGLVFEGLIDMVSVSIGGLSIKRGPLFEVFNRVSLRYTTVRWNTNPPIGGQQTETDLAENLSSQAQYGIIEASLSGGELFDDDANFYRDTYLAENSAPKSSTDIDFGASGLSVTLNVVGYYKWLEAFVYFDDALNELDLSTKLISVLAAEPNGMINSSTQRIATNALQVPAQDVGRKGWEVLTDLVELGDVTAQRYAFGVYEAQMPYYQLVAPQAFKYLYKARENKLVNYVGQQAVDAWRVRPATWVASDIPPFGAFRADPLKEPRAIFIEQVQYTAPFGLQITGARVDKASTLLTRYGAGAY